MINVLAWHRLRCLHIPVAILSLLLQRAPMLRLGISAESALSNSIAAILKGVFGAAALGSYHALAGATQLTTNPAPPVSGTVGVPLTVVFAFTGGSVSSGGSYEVKGQFPPGMTVTGLQGDLLNADFGELKGTPLTAGSYRLNIRGFSERNKKGVGGQITFPLDITIQAATATAPSFTTHPLSQSVIEGQGVVFSVAVTGTSPVAFQWTKDGVPLAGMTMATLTLSTTTLGSAGAYRVTATNGAGSVTSNAATLTVTPAVAAPVLVKQPVSQTILTGGTVVFEVGATGSNLAYQWARNSQPIPGATSSQLLLKNASNAQEGDYTATVSNSGGQATSAPAHLTLVTSTTPGRLINLSVRSFAGIGGQTLTAGFVLAGSGNGSMVIRGVGPTLAQFNVPDVLSDPQLVLFNSDQTPIQSNDNWSGSDGREVGGFVLPTGSKDAVLNVSVAPGGYTAQVVGTAGAVGEAMAEVYEQPGPPDAPRFINLSARTQLDAGRTLIAGFVIGGNTNRTVVVRAVGPGLDDFQVPGTLADPRLGLFREGTLVAENDDWLGGSVLIDAMASVAAFPLKSATSKDSALVITLPPGAYTANITGPAGISGVVLVEVYLMP